MLMCLIVFAWQPAQAIPLVVAANRDEFHERPSLPLAPWPERPELIAGRDLQGGGTWMGATLDGRFAALTNIRVPGQPVSPRSRGELPERFLASGLSPEAYMADLQARCADYAGFNLLVGDSQTLWHLNSHEGTPRALEPGLYGLSNASLDTPWPKLLRAKAALANCLERADSEALLELLADTQKAPIDQLPNTGVTLELETLLSSIFIASPNYGTRASTALVRRRDGSLEIRERAFGPDGRLGEVHFVHPKAAETPTLQNCSQLL